MIKAVLFDVDGVLISSFDANLKFFQNLLSKAGYKPPTRIWYVDKYQLSMTDVIKEVTKSKSEREIQRIWEMGNRRDVPYPTNLITMKSDVPDVLRKLYKRYRLGIVTQRVRNGVFEIPTMKKIRSLFSAVVAYEDTVNHKPDPEPLLLAAKKLKVNPKETIYIGDLENDIQAARAAGMKIIIYSTVQYRSADRYTSSFSEIPSLIESLHG